MVPLHPGLGSQPAGYMGLGWTSLQGFLWRSAPLAARPAGCPLLCPAILTSVCRFMCSRRVNFFPQMSQG